MEKIYVCFEIESLKYEVKLKKNYVSFQIEFFKYDVMIEKIHVSFRIQFLKYEVMIEKIYIFFQTEFSYFIHQDELDWVPSKRKLISMILFHPIRQESQIEFCARTEKTIFPFPFKWDMIVVTVSF